MGSIKVAITLDSGTLARVDGLAGSRPVLILSHDVFNERAGGRKLEQAYSAGRGIFSD